MELKPPFYTKRLTRLGRLIKGCLLDDRHAGSVFVDEIRAHPMSMLSAEALRAIHMLSRECRGAIIEIGAYVGGATAVILDATRERGNLVLTIEEPVEHPTHPQIPTHNTVEDLRANIRSLGLERNAHYIIPGTSFEAWVLGALQHRLLGQTVELLVWDADACFDRDLIFLSPFLADGCRVVIDDYAVGEAKSRRVSAVVDDFIRRGILATAAYLPWGTFIGWLRRKPRPVEVAEYRAEWESLASSGDVYYQRLATYEASLGGVPKCLTFEERKAFWRAATEWGKNRASNDIQSST